MTFGIVHASLASLPECQDVKLTFFVPCLNLAYEVKLTVVVNVLFKLVRIF